MKKYTWALAFIMVIPFIAQAQNNSQQRTQQQTPIQKRDRIHQLDHYLFMDGKLYRVQNGVRTEVKERMQLQNGVINPDGSYQFQNQDRLQLRSGECLDPSGNRYASQQMFNRNKMMTQQQVNRAQQQMNKQQRANPPMNNQGGRKMNNRRNN